jgi:hypothetical protein
MRRRAASTRTSRAHSPSHVIIVNPAAGALGGPSAGGPLGDPSVGAGLAPIATEPDEEIENVLGPPQELGVTHESG